MTHKIIRSADSTAARTRGGLDITEMKDEQILYISA